ncbi:MAG: thermonuclease family protein [Robiginitomaculum sp.]|nr:thermonuclease family protein [Robiginitomaculum sp.]
MCKLFLIILFLGLFPEIGLAADRVQGPISAKVLRVVDGDTIAVSALIWPGQRVEIKVRLAEVNAPETFRPACQEEKKIGQLATLFVSQQIGQQVDLQDIRLGKYAGRIVANIITASGEDLGELLLNAGLAHKQKDRNGWCNTPN